MAKQNVIVCDACGITKQAEDSTGSMWLNLSSMSSTDEYENVMKRMANGEQIQNLVDSGDFCSLSCVANWASARFELKSMDH